MTMFRNSYDCPCGTHWTDDWDCMCDDRCPSCNTSCSPSSSFELVDYSWPWIPFTPKEILQDGMIFDPGNFYEDSDRLTYGTFKWPSTEKDWERTKFIADEETPPDAKKRAQLKAKRKKK